MTINRTVAEVYFIDSGWSSSGQVEVFASPRWTSTWPELLQLELHRVVHHRLRLSPPRPSPGTTRPSRVVPGLGRGGLELNLHKEENKYIKAQNLLNYFRIHWTTSEFYWTTSDFYWTTWVFGSSNFSATWPGGSVLSWIMVGGSNIMKNDMTFHTCLV